MGFMFVTVACAGGRQLGMRKMITVNGDHPPTIEINGRPKEVCRKCFDYHNQSRAGRGLEPLNLHPKAYFNP